VVELAYPLKGGDGFKGRKMVSQKPNNEGGGGKK
jgi:hypothetical protein